MEQEFGRDRGLFASDRDNPGTSTGYQVLLFASIRFVRL